MLEQKYYGWNFQNLSKNFEVFSLKKVTYDIPDKKLIIELRWQDHLSKLLMYLNLIFADLKDKNAS